MARLPPPRAVDAGLGAAPPAPARRRRAAAARRRGLGSHDGRRAHAGDRRAGGAWGCPHALGGDRLTAAELAPRVGADADALHRVLRAAAVDGLVRLDRRGRFRLTRIGPALRSDAEVSLRDWARYMTLPSTQAAWGDLTESVRTGGAAFGRVHGSLRVGTGSPPIRRRSGCSPPRCAR